MTGEERGRDPRAETFIRSKREKFGFNAIHGFKPASMASLPAQEFTREHHFRFGYNGECWNERLTPICWFWTDYMPVSRPPRTLRDELVSVLREISALHGKISISNSGSTWSEALIAASMEAGIEFEQIILDFEGLPPVSPLREKGLRRVRSSFRELEHFAESFFERTGSLAPAEAFAAFFGEFSNRPHVYEGGHNRLVNRSFDLSQGAEVSVPYLVFVDTEATLSINRYLKITGRIGWPNLLKYTPELIASQLSHPLTLAWVESFAEPSSTQLPERVRNDPSSRRHNCRVEAEIFRSTFLPETDSTLTHPAAHFFPRWHDRIIKCSQHPDAPPMGRSMFNLFMLERTWGIRFPQSMPHGFYDEL